MITVYTLAHGRLEKGDASALSDAALWIDLLEPTEDEERAVERLLGIDLPTREEMQEIEASSRLYRQQEAIFMTAPVLTASDTPNPLNTPIAFVLTRGCTVTVRHATPQPFATFANRAVKARALCQTADAVLVELLDTIIDRLADVLERIGFDLESLSRDIFEAPPTAAGTPSGGRRDFRPILHAIGRSGDLTSKARDSLLGINRIVTFLMQSDEIQVRKENRPRVKTMSRDISSLSEHAMFLSGKITFLLDATLGLINIQQNDIIKIFSVVAVVFLPPTLIASLYGMNFEIMPELSWPFGYPFALALMVLSAVLPYLYFKRRGWL